MSCNINWNNFKFLIKRKKIDEIYVDGFYMDINKLQQTPIWDKYHNLQYWLDSDKKEIFLKYKTIDNKTFEEIKQWYKSIIK